MRYNGAGGTAMTITLTPETEMLLQERAARDGQDADTVANALLKDLLTAPKERTEEEKQEIFHRSLLESGLVRRLAPSRDPSKADRPTFEVLGEPLSETIIRERR